MARSSEELSVLKGRLTLLDETLYASLCLYEGGSVPVSFLVAPRGSTVGSSFLAARVRQAAAGIDLAPTEPAPYAQEVKHIMHRFHSLQQELHIVGSDSDDDLHDEELASLSRAVEQLQVVQRGLQSALTAARCIASIEDMHSVSTSVARMPISCPDSRAVVVSAAAAASALAGMRLYPPFAFIESARNTLVKEGYALLRAASASSSAASSPGQKGVKRPSSGAGDAAQPQAFMLSTASTTRADDEDLAAFALRVLQSCAADCDASGTAEFRVTSRSTDPPEQSTAGGKSQVAQRLQGALRRRATPSSRKGSTRLEHMELIGSHGLGGLAGGAGGQPLEEGDSGEDEAVSEDMVSMSSALREASQAMADRLRADNAVLDSATEAAGNNLSSISATQAELSAENQGATVTFISTLFLLAVVACVFVATYAAIRFLPK